MTPGPKAQPTGEGVRFSARVTPRGGKDVVEGWRKESDGRYALKLRVRAAPAENEANEAVIGLLAETLGVAKRAVEIARGGAARTKIIDVKGDPALLAKKLEALKDIA